MAIDAKLIKQLREITGMGITNCKKALEESNGDLEKAEMILRKQGLDKAAKKADRPTGQGVIAIKVDGNKAAIVELACEQEPTTNNERFVALVQLLLETALKNNSKSAKELLEAKSPDGTIDDSLKAVIGVVGENIQLKKANTVKAPENGLIGAYSHFNKKSGALVVVELDKADKNNSELATLANDIAMHSVATRPLSWCREEISEELLNKEKELYEEEVKNKPENIREKILSGKIEKFYADKVLVEQIFVKDPEGKNTVKNVLENAAKNAGGNAKICELVRFELGL